MRRVFLSLLSILALSIGAAVTLSLPSTPQSYVHVPTEPSPTSPMGMPTCDTEDGAGMALCWWDAQAQGNGQGNSVVSGDCAPSIMGESASALCVTLYDRPSAEVSNSDGSFNTIPNGADLVGECVMDKSATPIEECIRGWM